MKRDQHIATIEREDHRELTVALDAEHMGGMDSVTISKSAAFIISVMPPNDAQAYLVHEIDGRQIGGYWLTKFMAGSSF
ncbi:hypothetical protein [Pseudomonas sediminis]|uniref:hypothetical protein n=1 Tax=Pseudomonas sediminis TaxID=1691904 RepID=UPI0031CCBC93